MELLLAPSGRGKTAHLIQRVQATRREAGGLAPIWVIVPNRVQAQAMRRRLAAEGGALGVEVSTFYDCYVEILARAGQPAPRLFDPVQHRLLRGAVDQLHAQGQLSFFAPLRDKPGFLRLLRTLILELKRARVQPAAFTAATADQPPRLAELAQVYNLYQQWLVTTGWADAEGQGWLATLALEADPALCSDLRLLAVDGFDEFNPTQLAVLRLLVGRAATTVVTLTGDLRPRLAHRRFDRARETLVEAMAQGPQTGDPPGGLALLLLDTAAPDLCGPLADLEARLFEPAGDEPIPAEGAIALVEAQHRAEEVRAALRWLKKLIVYEGFAPGEVAVLARHLEPYRPFLSEIGTEFGLPLHLTGSDPALSGNPAVAALFNLLALPLRNWPRRAVLDAWRNPYFDWRGVLGVGQANAPAISAEQVAASLDAAARAARVMAGLEQWREGLDTLAGQAVSDVATEDEDQGAAAAGWQQDVAALRVAFEAFVARVQPPEHSVTAGYVAFVEDLIGDDPHLAPRFRDPEAVQDDSLRVVAMARAAAETAERDVAALQALKDVLRGLVLAETLAASPPFSLAAGSMPYSRFFDDLSGAVEAATYRAPWPETGVVPCLAAPVLHARGLSFRAVAVLGLAEGEFPHAEHEDPLLRESDRHLLRARGLPVTPRLTGDEATFFYEAITRARQRLLLTRPYLTDDGQPWEPSPYWKEVQRLVQAGVAHIRPGDSLPAADVASPQELLTLLVQRATRASGDWEPLETLAETPFDLAQSWRQVLHAAAVLDARTRRRPAARAGSSAGPHEGDLNALSDQLRAVFGSEHVWSSSRLEAYATCPYNFFAGSALALEAPPLTEAGFDQRTLGSIYHAVLEQLYRQAIEQGDWSSEGLLAALPVVAQAVFADAPRNYGFRTTPLWEAQQRELTQILARTVQSLAEAAGEHRPLALEQAFGLADQPPLVVDTPDGPLTLRGYIDRLDQAPDGQLRVIDYKSGSTPISVRDLDEGKRIQLPLYALAAQRALGLGEVAGGFYWHIGSAKASSLKLETYLGGVGAAVEVAVTHAASAVRAIRAGDFEPRPPTAGCPPSCPATAFCWHFRPKRA